METCRLLATPVFGSVPDFVSRSLEINSQPHIYTSHRVVAQPDAQAIAQTVVDTPTDRTYGIDDISLLI
jgi:hypothetical protein